MLELKVGIAIKVWRRPAYFKKVMEGLTTAMQFYQQYEAFIEKRDGPERDRVIYTGCEISIDHSQIAIEASHIEIIANYRQDLKNFGMYSVLFYKHDKVQGCAGNTKYILRKGFELNNLDAVIHLEDDTVPAADFLIYMAKKYLWMHRQDLSYFAICPFNRIAVQDSIKCNIDLQTSYIKAWFECGGGFLLPRYSWELIEDRGGIFGAIGNANRPDLVGEAWKDSIHVTPHGSWAWPINQYFRKRSLTEHLCVFPAISRIQNIGQLGGVFNPSSKWHKENIYDPNWSGLYSTETLMIASRGTWQTDFNIILPA